METPGTARDPRRATVRPAEELPDLGKVSGWRLAPIHWGGSVSANMNRFKSDNGNGSTSISELLNLRSASHIYQPWLAQVNGTLGLSNSTTKRTFPQDSRGQDTSDVRSRAVNFGGTLNLFPLSRFPFQTYFDRSDSRAMSDTINSGYTSTRFGMRQSYRPPVGSENFAATYDRSSVKSDNTSSTVDSLQGYYSASLDQHAFTANSRFAQTTGGINGERSRLLSAAGTHNWRNDDGLTVSSTGTISDQEFRYLTTGSLASFNTRLMQWNSSATWIPDEDVPLTITGSGNLTNINTQTSGGSTQFMNLGAFAGLSYRFSNRLTGTANFQFNHTSSGGFKTQLIGGTGTVSYIGIPLALGKFNYNWNLAGSAGMQALSGGTGSANNSLQTVTGNASHNLSRSFVLSPRNALTMGVSQGVAIASSNQIGQTTTLTHSGTASWHMTYREGVNASLSASVADNISKGKYQTEYQTANIFGNALAQISRRANFNANLNLTWFRNKQPQPENQQPQQLGVLVYDPNSTQWSGGAAIGYTHYRPFDVMNLSYDARILYNYSQFNQRLINADPNALTYQDTRSFQQRLFYRIGRLSFQALNTLSTTNGKKNASVFFQVSRDFGS